jgi:hypothetical protein
MRECDLLKAVEQAAFSYLFGLLTNRISRLLGKRALAALVILVGAALADGPLPTGDIIGLVVTIGIAIRSFYDVIKTIKEIVEGFRNGIWQQFKRLPQQLLNASLRNCLDQKPECCELFQREVDKLLLQWVKELKPGWKKGGPFAGSVK